MVIKKKLTLEEKQNIVNKWVEKNGCATFDLTEENIVFHDGGGFSVEKKIRYRPRYRTKPITSGSLKGGSEMYPIKGPKVKYEVYECHYWFGDLDDTINRLRRMRDMLHKLGYKTNSYDRGGKK